MKTIVLIFTIFALFFSIPAHAATLTSRQKERLTVAKKLLKDVDIRSIDKISEELSKTKSIEGNLQILEAVARTYSEMQREYKVKNKEQKAWLHSMVLLNMAYFQLGGKHIERNNESGFNIMIRRKLKQHLSPELMKDPSLFTSLNNQEQKNRIK